MILGLTVIKTFYKYYLIHKKSNLYPDINVSSIKMYYYMIVNFLKDNLIIPNEEMMSILSKFFSKIIYQERESLNKKKEEEIDSKAKFQIEKNKNFLCYIKFCFTSKKIFKSKIMIKAAIKEYNNCNMIIKTGKKNLKPIIVVKVKEFVHSTEFFSPKKIYKLAQYTFNDFFDNAELDMNKLKIKNVRDILVNLILYGMELNKEEEFLPVDYLIYTLYLLKDIEEK